MKRCGRFVGAIIKRVRNSRASLRRTLFHHSCFFQERFPPAAHMMTKHRSTNRSMRMPHHLNLDSALTVNRTSACASESPKNLQAAPNKWCAKRCRRGSRPDRSSLRGEIQRFPSPMHGLGNAIYLRLRRLGGGKRNLKEERRHVQGRGSVACVLRSAQGDNSHN